jgi:hypothetical protein
VKIAAADAAKRRAAAAAPATVEAPAPDAAPAAVVLASAPAAQSGGVFGGLTGSAQTVKNWLHLGGQAPAQPLVEAYVPDQPIPTDAPLPPRRDDAVSQAESSVRVASQNAAPTPPARPGSAETGPADPNSPQTTSAPSPAQ